MQSPNTNRAGFPPRWRPPLRLRCSTFALLTALVLPVTATAGESSPEKPCGKPTHEPSRAAPNGGSWAVNVSPGADLHPRYIADPRRPVFTLAAMHYRDPAIADAGESRLLVKLGGRYGLLRFHPKDAPDRGFQLDVEAGFLGLFDRDNNTDNIGWDGTYGWQLAWRPTARGALRFGFFHVSSHVGDEHAERTGRRRIGYTRGEYYLGGSLEPARGLRFYGEGAYATDLRNDELMDPGRIQAGLDYTSPPIIAGSVSWYVAGDFSAFEENDWEPNRTIQVGLVYPVGEQGRVYRLALEYYEGRSTVGEFFQDQESYLAFGLWFDL